MDVLEGLHNAGDCSFCNLFTSISTAIKEHMGDHVQKYFMEKYPNSDIQSKVTVNAVLNDDGEKEKDKEGRDIEDSFKFVEEGIAVDDLKESTHFVLVDEEYETTEKSLALEFRSRPKKCITKNSSIKRKSIYEKKNDAFIENNYSAEKIITMDNKLSDPENGPENDTDISDKSEKENNVSKKNHNSGVKNEILNTEINDTSQYGSENENGLNGKKFDQLLKEYYKKDGHSFKCILCPSIFYSQSNFKDHVTSVHKENCAEAEHICKQCDARFLKKSSLKNHYLRHQPAVKCEKCDKQYSTKLTLKKHQKLNCNDIKSSEEVCEFCGKEFKTKDHVKHHYKTVHLNLRRYQCSICSNTFKTITHFQNHCLGKHKFAKNEIKQYLMMVKPDGDEEHSY